RRPVEAEVGDDGVEVGVGRQGPEVPQRGHLALHVVDSGADQEPEEGPASELVEPAGDAEVQQSSPSIGENEEVPAVEVAVEDPAEHGAFEEADHPGPDQGGRVEPGGPHALAVVEVEAG